jgi:hypothetical protein
VESSGFERDEDRTVESDVDGMFGVERLGEGPDGVLLSGCSSWIWEVPRTEPVLVRDRSLDDVDGSGVVLR